MISQADEPVAEKKKEDSTTTEAQPAAETSAEAPAKGDDKTEAPKEEEPKKDDAPKVEEPVKEETAVKEDAAAPAKESSPGSKKRDAEDAAIADEKKDGTPPKKQDVAKVSVASIEHVRVYLRYTMSPLGVLSPLNRSHAHQCSSIISCHIYHHCVPL